MNQFKHANWWRSYLGELSKDFGWLQAWLSSGNTSTSNGEEENRVKKTAAVFFRTFEALSEVHFCMLYTIWNLRKSRIERFKPCMIWSWNEEDMAFGRQLHHVKWPISQGGFRHIAKFLWLPVLRRCWCYSTAGSPRYFAWLLAL